MKLNYDGFSFKAKFYFNLKQNGKTIAHRNVMDGAACFGCIFNYLEGGKVYEATYKIRCDKNFEAYSGNYCSLDRSQINRIIRYMRETFEISTHISDMGDYYLFIFKVEGLAVKHKVILTFSRVFFEYPYNELAKDVFRLREAGVVDGINYSNKSFLELFHLMNITYKDFWGSGHSLFVYPCSDFNIKALKDAFAQGRSRVQDIYYGKSELRNKVATIKWNRSGIDWDDDFEERLPYYSENFKTLRLLKQKQNEKGVRRRARKAL